MSNRSGIDRVITQRHLDLVCSVILCSCSIVLLLLRGLDAKVIIISPSTRS